MEETEKMSALKKAYAEIILNASKEAAARIIVSERRAQGFQRELSVTKDEALRLCLRIKQMMDSMMNEAAMKSLSQQRRIDVLEAQLQEAEDIVSNLRAELAEAQLELSMLTKNQRRPFDEKIFPEGAADEEQNELLGQEEKINTGFTSSMVQPQSLSFPKAKDSVFERRFCQANGIKSNGDAEYSFARKPEASSVAVRKTEPELYRNGCTQRIRACELNGLTDHVTHSLRPDHLEGENIIQKENGVEGSVGMVEEKLDAGREILTGASACCRGFQFKSFHKKRRRGPRHKRNNAHEWKSLPVDAAIAIKETLDPSQSMTFCSSTSNLSSSITNLEDRNSLEKVLDQQTTLSIKQTSESSIASTQTDMNLVDALILIKQETGSKKDLGAVGCEARAEVPTRSSAILEEKAEVPTRSSAILEAKVERLNEGVVTESPNKDRIVKYTFQRKRKRESMSNKERDHNPQVVEAVDLKAGTNCDGDGVGYRSESTLASDSPRNSRRLVQVARQLISLSDKKWWE